MDAGPWLRQNPSRGQPGQTIDDRWRIVQLLGQGTYGAVYEVAKTATNDHQHYALKVESKEEQGGAMKMEVAILKTFSRLATPTPRICKYVAHSQTETIRYVVMELLGHSLWQQRRAWRKKFSGTTSILLSIQCFDAIETVHKIGFLHRDVKPANFAMGRGSSIRLVYIIDFGVAPVRHA